MVTNDTEAYDPEILSMMGIVHLCLSIGMIVLQVLIRSRLILKENWRSMFQAFRHQLLLDENVRRDREQLILSYLEKDLNKITF